MNNELRGYGLHWTTSEVKTYDQSESYITIEGFISEPKLSELVKNYKGARIFPPLERDTFKRIDVVLLYDENEALSRLGFSILDKPFPAAKDHSRFTERLRELITEQEIKPLNYYVEFDDGQKIYLLDRIDKARFYSDIPNILKSELLMKVENRKNPVGYLAPRKDLFPMIVTRDLKGKDLIYACNTSSEVNQQCNKNDFALYKQRLREEFEVNFDQEFYGYPDARTLYIQMHTLFGILQYRVNQNTGKFASSTIIGHFGELPHGRRPDLPIHVVLPPYVEGRSPVKEFYFIWHPGRDNLSDSHSFLFNGPNADEPFIYDGKDPEMEDMKFKHSFFRHLWYGPGDKQSVYNNRLRTSERSLVTRLDLI